MPTAKGFSTTMTPDEQLALKVAQAVATTLAPVAGSMAALIDLQEKMLGGNEATHNRLRLIEERLALIETLLISLRGKSLRVVGS